MSNRNSSSSPISSPSPAPNTIPSEPSTTAVVVALGFARITSVDVCGLRLSVAFPASAFFSKAARATLLDDPGRVSAGFLTTDVRGALALATGRALVAVVVRTLGLMVVVVVVAVEDAVRSRDAAAAGWERVDVAESDGTRRGVEAERDAPTRAAAERVVDNARGPLASGLASIVFDAGGSAGGKDSLRARANGSSDSFEQPTSYI